MLRLLCIFYAATLAAGTVAGEPSARDAPLVKDFLGVCGHTIQFRPKLYRPAVRLARDYHPFDWDVGDDTSSTTIFPLARNGVDWNAVYGSWNKEGFDTDVSIMFDNVKPAAWKKPAEDARRYGAAFARAFGPSSPRPLVRSAEVGNEPGKYSDADYRTIFEGMARGFREGDLNLKIVTCAATPGKSHEYAKSLQCFKGLEALYDVVNIHVYAQVEGWPSWRRSFPEDPAIPYLQEIALALEWRNANAPGKPVWLTEFGWDASTKPAPKSGTFAKWKGNSETEQARWLVRSTLLFQRMGLARAYIYFFNDEDEPQVHGSSGLTRRFKPKPSFYSLAHLQRVLGEFRFARVVREAFGDSLAFEYTAAGAHNVWVVWSPTASGRMTTLRLPLEGRRLLKAERMPLTAGAVPSVAVKIVDGIAELPVTESPLYIWLTTATDSAE